MASTKWRTLIVICGDYEDTTELEECMDRLKVIKADDPEEKAKMDKLREEYEKSIVHKSQIPPYGIKEPSKVCSYPVEFGGKVKSGICKEEIEREYTSYTPKHIDTPEEKVQKYYHEVLKDYKELCDANREIECLERPPRQNRIDNMEEKRMPKAIMITKPDVVEQDCPKKTVTFEDDRDRCRIDQNDICDLKREKTQCGCTDYEKCL